LPTDVLDELPVGGNEDKASRGKERRQVAAAGALDQIKRIESAYSQLKTINGALASIFNNYFGVQAYLSGDKAPSVLRDLFVQVRRIPQIYVSL
jgi:hypothetical protein